MTSGDDETKPIRLVPLGGLGEFGLNAFVLEWEDHLLLLDAGMLFPSADMPGVDSVVPDFEYLAEPHFAGWCGNLHDLTVGDIANPLNEDQRPGNSRNRAIFFGDQRGPLRVSHFRISRFAFHQAGHLLIDPSDHGL